MQKHVYIACVDEMRATHLMHMRHVAHIRIYHIYMYWCTYVHIHFHIYIYIYIYTYVCIHTDIACVDEMRATHLIHMRHVAHIRIYHMHMYVCTYVHIYIYIYIHIYIHICMYTYWYRLCGWDTRNTSDSYASCCTYILWIRRVTRVVLIHVSPAQTLLFSYTSCDARLNEYVSHFMNTWMNTYNILWIRISRVTCVNEKRVSKQQCLWMRQCLWKRHVYQNNVTYVWMRHVLFWYTFFSIWVLRLLMFIFKTTVSHSETLLFWYSCLNHTCDATYT